MKIETKFYYRWLLGLLLLAVSGCTTVAVQEGQLYHLDNKNYLYNLANWSFQGRLAVTSSTDSWSASIDWTHQPSQDLLKLSGPLGQGAVVIELTNEQIKIDQGDGQVTYAADADQLIAEKLGVFVPVSALKYWVLGLVQPEADFQARDTGFQQASWTVDYPLYMIVENQLMPHKMKAINDQLKLTLVIDQWQL